VGRRTSNRSSQTSFFRSRPRTLAAALTLLVAGLTYRLIPRGSHESAAPVTQRFIGGADDGYVNGESCAVCHREIAASFRKTGMGRSFYRPRPENMVEDFAKANTFFHTPSDEHYTMIRRGDEYFQRRHQLDAQGGEINVVEQQLNYVMGSGNHARSYLHLDSNGKLTQMPLGWYSEKGGVWAMSPNYDTPQHQGFQREIGYGCMFCHNGYPETAPGEDAWGSEPRYRGKMPEGIDCQRCHGPGREHIKAASAGATREKIRAAILNPKRLEPERQLEICMQCHLETTTRSLPTSVIRFDRNVFSFRPGQPLSDNILHFDYAPGKEPADRFEIAHTAYRLRKSACFLQTAGTPKAMTCTTCHNPHDALRGEAAAAHYVEVCRQCHAAGFNAMVAAGRHSAAKDCLTCHMPKRRTDDVVHAVMTDHYIQRRKPARDLLAPLNERQEDAATRYRGEAVLYYPPKPPAANQTELYLAVAQVIDSSNLANGTPRLRQAIETFRPKQGAFYYHLAEADASLGNSEEALKMYRVAVERAPKHRGSWLSYAIALSGAGRAAKRPQCCNRRLQSSPTTRRY
jgi:predicted CXXCH cytochrome family protein